MLEEVDENKLDRPSRFKKKLLLASAITALYSFVVVPFNRWVNFDLPFQSRLYDYVSTLSWLLFTILFGIAVFGAITFIERFNTGHKLYRRWGYVSLSYLAINAIVLVLIWPGFWIWDEFILLQYSVRVGSFGVWQHVFTGLYFTLCLHLFPTAVGIVLFQTALSSVVVGYIVAKTDAFLTTRNLSLLLLLPFLLPPVILNTFYPLRLTVYSYLEVLLLFRLLIIHRQPKSKKSSHVEMVSMTILITLLAFWRTEGIYYVLLIPYLVFLYNIHVDFFQRKRAWLTVSTCVLLVSCGLLATVATSSPKYQVTASITPLSLMLQHHLAGDTVNKNLAAIDKVVDIEMVRSMPSATDIESYWAGALRSDFENHLQTYNRAFISLVASNPLLFLDAKFQTLLAANSLTTFVPQVHEARVFLEPRDDEKSVIADFERREYLGKPLNPHLRKRVVNALLMLSPTGRPSEFASIVWSVLPITAITTGVFLWSLATRKYLYALISALILTRFIIVFLTAPAAFFMYYLPVYISGWMLVFFIGVQAIDKRLQRTDPLDEKT